MSYHKILVDNPTCSRRFHVTYDDNEQKQATVSLDCPFCGVTIFSKKDHPPVSLARQENLTQTTRLSDDLVTECRLSDKFSRSTNPMYSETLKL